MRQWMPAFSLEAAGTATLAALRSAGARLRRHAIPLAGVLGACAIGQAATLIQPLPTHTWPDTQQYVAVTHRILTSLQFADPVRTPGYPLFLAGIYLTAGDHTRTIILAQALLMVLTAVELYVLGLRIGLSRPFAALVAAMIGVNIFILNWERLVLSETLSFWLIVTLFLAFAGYLRTPRLSGAIWVGLLSAAAILTRPVFIYLPALLALVLAARAVRLRRVRVELLPLGVLLATAYGAVVLYMASNALANGYFGLSDVGSINLFGKVLEAHAHYGMPLTGASPEVAALAADAQRYAAAGGSDPFLFTHTHAQYNAHNYALYGTYSTQIFEHHPLFFLRSALGDARTAWLARQWLWAPNTVNPFWVLALGKLAAAQYHAYVLLPLLLVVMSAWAWRRPERTDAALLLALLATVAAQILMAGAADFTEQYRIRFPLDWAMLFSGWVLGIAVLRLGWDLVRKRMARKRMVSRTGVDQAVTVSTRRG